MICYTYLASSVMHIGDQGAKINSQNKAENAFFVGYQFGKKAWRLYNMETNEFFISRDVIFFEDKFPGIESTSYVLPPILQNNKLIDD